MRFISIGITENIFKIKNEISCELVSTVSKKILELFLEKIIQISLGQKRLPGSKLKELNSVSGFSRSSCINCIFLGLKSIKKQNKHFNIR